MKKGSIYICLCFVLTSVLSCQRQTEEAVTERQVTVHTGLKATRAAIDNFDNTEVQILRGNAPDNFSESWPAIINNTNSLTFNPVRIYPLTDESVVLRGFYPKPAETVTGNRTNYSYSLADGESDILCSNIVTGSYLSPISEIMKFEHLTAQIQITANNDETFPIFRKITKVVLYGLQVAASLNVVTGELTFSGDEKPITIYEDAKGLTPGIHVNTPIGSPKMIQPGATNIEVEFTFDKGEDAPQRLPLHFDRATDFDGSQTDNGDTPLKGVSYEIRFVLTSFTIKPQITVQEWKMSDKTINMPTIW